MSPPTSTLFAATLTAVQCFESGAFVVGANLPWILYGLDFGANRWRPNGGVAQGDLREPLNRKLAQLAAAGVTMVRWFLLCDGRAGIRFSDNGSPDGLDACVLPDIDAALDATNGHGLRVLFVLLDFHWCKSVQWVNGVQLGGRREVLERQESRQRLLDRIVRPILERYSADERICAWEVINEPEWVTFGLGARNPVTSLSRSALRAFITETAALVHDVTSQPITVGSAGSRWSSFYGDLALDFDQVHWYDTLTRTPPLATPVAQLGFSRPVLLGEFPTVASAHSVSQILDLARSAGYVGALHWPGENMG